MKLRSLSALAAAGVLLLLVGWWWHGRSDAKPGVTPAAAAHSSAGTWGAAPSAGGAWLAPVPPGRGPLTIRGEVRGSAGPLAGATVTATTVQGQEVISNLRCHCGNDCGQKLLECGCPEASAQLVDLVAERRGEAPPVARATTDAQGRFILTGLEPGSYGVWADAAGAGTGFVGDVRAGEAGVVVELGGGLAITGEVKSEEGRPLPGAIVTAVHGRHSRFFDAVSAADGRFAIGPLPPGRYAVVATHPGLLPAHEHLREGAGAPVELRLLAPRRLSGHVTLDGRPVADAAVTAHGEHRSVEARTDRDGAFAFSGLRPGEYELRAAALERVAQRTATVPIGRDLGEVTLALGAGAYVEGTVLDERRAAVVGASVSIDERAPHRRSNVARATADAAGRFRLGPLERGEYEVSARLSGFLAGERRRVTLVEDQRLELALTRALRVQGLVVDPDGRPMAAAHVEAEPAKGTRPGRARGDWARTDDDGTFQLDLDAGEYRVVASMEGLRAAEAQVRAPASGLRLALGRGAAVQGSVLDAEGRPLSGVQVAILDPDHESHRAAGSTDAQGRFRIAGLEAGRLEAIAMARRPADEDDVPTGFAYATIDVPAEGTVTVELRFEAGRSIDGTVVAQDGTPIQGVRVRAWGARPQPVGEGAERRRAMFEGMSMGGATSDAQGAFTVRGLKPGRHQVLVEKEGYDRPAEPLRVEAGASGLRIVLTRAGAVRGRVVGDGGAPLVATVNGRRTGDDGTFTVTVRGKAEQQALVLTAEGYAATRRTVTVTPGVDLDLGDVALGHGRALAGSVVDADTGAPVAGALVDATSIGEDGRPMGDGQQQLAGPDGRFVLEQVGDRARLIVKGEGYAPATLDVGTGSSSVAVQLSSGASLTVRVVAAGGEPIPGALIFISGPDQRTQVETGGGDGRHTFSGLAAGSYVVRADDSAGHRRLYPQVVEVGARARAELELRERPGAATLEIVASGPGLEAGSQDVVLALAPGLVPAIEDGRALLQAMMTAIEAEGEGTRGQFTQLAAGTYTVIVLRPSPGGAAVYTRPVQVGEGPVQRLDVVVPADLRVIPAPVAPVD